jgi:membrane protease YdiL (CAAX protease family)
MSGRLIAWLVLVGVIAVINYSARATEGKPDRDLVYHYSTAVGALIQYGIFFGIVLLIAKGQVRELLALRQPRSWFPAVRVAGGVLVAVYVLSLALNPLLHPGEEQGLTPTGWDPSRAGAFAASFIAIALVGPFVEEAMFRGLGFSLLVPYGTGVAIVVIGLTFGLYHGLIEALPILAAFGAGLAYLRARTDSLYPCFVVHALFNAIALTLSVTT